MRVEERDDSRKLVLTLVGKTTLNGKTYTANDSDGTVQKKAFGLSDDWYGGMVKEFRKIKGSKIMMCLDKRDRVINLAFVEEDLTDADRVLLGLKVEELKVEEDLENLADDYEVKGDTAKELNEPVMDSITDDTENEPVMDSITDDKEAVKNAGKNGQKKK